MNSRPKNSENTAVTFARKKYGNNRTKLHGPKKKTQTPACIGLRHRKPKCHLNAVGPRKPRRILSKTKKVGDGDGDDGDDDNTDADGAGDGDGNGDDGDGDCDDGDGYGDGGGMVMMMMMMMMVMNMMMMMMMKMMMMIMNDDG